MFEGETDLADIFRAKVPVFILHLIGYRISLKLDPSANERRLGAERILAAVVKGS